MKSGAEASRGDAFAAQDSGPARILLVDDDADVRESAGLVLRLEGYRVDLADRTAQALQSIEAFKPHLALVDIGLGSESGYDLARRIRALPAGRDMVLVAMSGYEDTERSAESGFDMHLIKPVDPDALLALVREKTGAF